MAELGVRKGARWLAVMAGAALGTLAVAAVAAAADRVVNVYNWSDYIDPQVLEDFTKETGITVKYDTFDSNDLVETKLLAGRTGYDVVVPSGHFLGRQIKAGVFRPLDTAKLPHLADQWGEITKRLASYDPGNRYATNYMWGTTGIGYNEKKVAERLPGVTVDSWSILFDPQYAAKLKDCGIMMLDASDEVIPIMLIWSGLNGNSKAPEDFKAMASKFKAVRPFVRKFHSSEYIDALANGDVCMVLGWSGDIKQAAKRAEERNAKLTDETKKVTVKYVIPKEGAPIWFDNFALPKDAKNIDEAHAFIDYMLRPEVAAKNANFTSYGSGSLAAQKLIDPAILNDPGTYPPPDVMAKLTELTPNDQKVQRELTAAWREIKRR
jgi:putrescine transport system substrate-binding protein